VYQHLEYFPYGETWIEEGGSHGGNLPGYKFTGKELDPETGLYYYGARYYEPMLSKWISADPILGKYLPNVNKDSDNNLPGSGGVYRSLNLNLYHYGLNNPVRYMDPTGQFPAETGGKYDWFQSANFQTGSGLVNGVLNETANVGGFVGNNVLNAMGYANKGAHWLVTDVLGGSEADYEALGVFFMVEGAAGRLGSASKIGTKAETSTVESESASIQLTSEQAQSLTRFNKKLPKGNTGTAVDPLGDQALFSSEVPGKVPGSKAVYQKSVDKAGNTTSYLKTTTDPQGNVLHIKDKLNGGTIEPQ